MNLSFDYSLFLHINMISGTTYNLSSSISYLFVDQSNNNTKNANIILPVLNNGQSIYIQGCGSNNTQYSIGIAGDIIGGVRIYNGYAYSDIGEGIVAGTTYEYTYYTANNNPFDGSYASPSWSLTTLSTNQIPFNYNNNLHIIYTNNNQVVTGYCNLSLNSIATGMQIRFKDLNGYLNITQLQIVGSSSYVINNNTTETLNTANMSKLYVWTGNSSGGNLITL